MLHLIFCQIVTDVLTKSMARIMNTEKSEMLQVGRICIPRSSSNCWDNIISKFSTSQLFDRYDITLNNLHSNQHKANTKRSVIEVAQHWLLYFARMFPVSVSSAPTLYLFLSLRRGFCRSLRKRTNAAAGKYERKVFPRANPPNIQKP